MVSKAEQLPSRTYAYYVEPVAPGDRPRRFLEIFAAVLKYSNYRFILDMYSKVTTKCGRCSSSCPVYEASGDPEDLPCYRSELLLRVYRRHFTIAGMLRGRLLGDHFLTDEDIDEMAEAFYRCTACRRCTMECPMGIDHGLITHLGRYMLSEMGIAPKGLVVATREQLEGVTGNTSAIPVPALVDWCQFYQDDIKDMRGVEVPFPIDVEGAEYLFLPPVSDFLMEAETLMGIATVLHVAGVSWTIGTGCFDAINYGLFYNDRLLARIVRKQVDEMRRLKADKILVGECGHASRAAKSYVPTFCGGRDAPPVINCMELTLQLLEEGRITLDPSVITQRVTYHDPCNIARKGWIVDQPRIIMRSFIKDFVEMTPHGTSNYCCGGGGGTVSLDEIRAFRTGVAGQRKVEQLRATGADIVVAPCANCKKQLRELVQDHGLDMEVKGLHDLILSAIKL